MRCLCSNVVCCGSVVSKTGPHSIHVNRREVTPVPTFAPPKPLTERIIEARRRARLFRVQGETTLAARWDDRVDQLLDQLPR